MENLNELKKHIINVNFAKKFLLWQNLVFWMKSYDCKLKKYKILFQFLSACDWLKKICKIKAPKTILITTGKVEFASEIS